ncbi:MAG: tetratricopeptide repeat protein [Steroidobacteraceae bacterium]
MMPDPVRSMSALRGATLAIFTLLLAGCATAPPKADAPAAATVAPKGESEALMAAELALRDGNCRVASENYLAAAMASAEPQVSARASQLALGCNQLNTARAATVRWRELEPWSGDAALATALVALKRYDLVEARAALVAWRDSGSAGSQDPLAFAEVLERESDATALYRIFGDVLVGEDPTADVLLAQARLALAAQNMGEALKVASRAAELDTRLIEARTIMLRAMSVLGQDEQAIAGARALQPEELTGEDIFLLADLLNAADREEEAGKELQKLAGEEATRMGAERRLIAMAIRNGDLDGAERRLEPLMGERGNTALAILYLAQLAERRGDDVRAIQSYRLLGDSSLALPARSAAARLMLKHGDRQNAMALLDEYAAQNPQAALEAGAARAQLLAEAGDLDAALQGLDELQQAYPDFPDLDYTRATVLESGGRTREAVAEFERALKRRPQDPQLQNALAFTLADHKTRLPRAETLVRGALAVSPDNAAIQDTLGWVLYRRGKTREALPVLARAWRNSSDAEIAAHFGEVLWKSGDQGQARYIWQQALNSEPAHRHLRETMARVTGEAQP